MKRMRACVWFGDHLPARAPSLCARRQDPDGARSTQEIEESSELSETRVQFGRPTGGGSGHRPREGTDHRYAGLSGSQRGLAEGNFIVSEFWRVSLKTLRRVGQRGRQITGVGG